MKEKVYQMVGYLVQIGKLSLLVLSRVSTAKYNNPPNALREKPASSSVVQFHVSSALSFCFLTVKYHFLKVILP